MKTRIALALALGGSMAFGAVACDSSSTSTSTGGSGGDGGGGCNLANDTDTGTITFGVKNLQIPRSASGDGFDIDGLKTDGSTTPVASDATGCYWKDIAPVGGIRNVDNQLAAVAAASNAIGIDLSKAMQDTLDSGNVGLRAVISHWNNTLTDNCLSVDLQADPGTGTFTSVAKTTTSISNGLTPVVSLDAPITFNVTLTLPPGPNIANCNPGTYAAGTSPCTNLNYTCSSTIPITVQGVKLRAHVVADAAAQGGYRLVTNTPNVAGSPTVANPSLIGGYVVYWDTSSGSRPACSNSNLTGPDFEATLQRAICELGKGTLWTQACPIVAQNLDLHEEGGSLTSCAPGATMTTSNGNAISFAAYAGN